MSSSLLVTLLAVACCLGLNACYHTVLIDPALIVSNNESDIIVATTDGRHIMLDAQKYNVLIDDDGRQVIQGKGRVFFRGESDIQPFEGSIPIEQVESVSKSEKSALVSVILPLILLAGAVWLVLTLLGGSPGG
jgi:hypothetical protein